MQRLKHTLAEAIEFVAFHWTRTAQMCAGALDVADAPAELAYITINGTLRANATRIAWNITEPPKVAGAQMVFTATCHEIGVAPIDIVDAMREVKTVDVTLLFGKTGRRLSATCHVENMSYTCGINGERGLVYKLVGHTHGRFK